MKLIIAFAAGASAVVYHEHAATNHLMQQVARHMPTLACDDTPEACATQMQEDMMACSMPLYSVMSDPACSDYLAASLAMSGGSLSDSINDSMDSLCSGTCLTILGEALGEYGACFDEAMAAYDDSPYAVDLGDSMTGIVDFMCLKEDASGDYCITKLTVHANYMAQTSSYTSPDGSLTSLCTTFQSLGCCMTSLLEYSQSMMGDAFDIMSGFQCALPPACVAYGASASYKQAAFELDSTPFANADLEDLELLGQLRDDLATLIGAPAENIDVDITQDGNMIKVTVVVRGDTDAETQTYDLSGVVGGSLTLTTAHLGAATPLTIPNAALSDGQLANGVVDEDTGSAAAALVPAVAVVTAVLM